MSDLPFPDGLLQAASTWMIALAIARIIAPFIVRWVDGWPRLPPPPNLNFSPRVWVAKHERETLAKVFGEITKRKAIVDGLGLRYFRPCVWSPFRDRCWRWGLWLSKRRYLNLLPMGIPGGSYLAWHCVFHHLVWRMLGIHFVTFTGTYDEISFLYAHFHESEGIPLSVFWKLHETVRDELGDFAMRNYFRETSGFQRGSNVDRYLQEKLDFMKYYWRKAQADHKG